MVVAIVELAAVMVVMVMVVVVMIARGVRVDKLLAGCAGDVGVRGGCVCLGIRDVDATLRGQCISDSPTFHRK